MVFNTMHTGPVLVQNCIVAFNDLRIMTIDLYIKNQAKFLILAC